MGKPNSLQRYFFGFLAYRSVTVFVRYKDTSFPCCWKTISELFHLWGRKTPFSISQRNCVPFCPNRVFFQKKVLLLYAIKNTKPKAATLGFLCSTWQSFYVPLWSAGYERKPHTIFICAKVQKKFRHPNRKG